MAAVQSRSLLSEVDPYDASPDVPFTLERAKEILNDAGASAILQILYQLQHPQAEKLILQQEVTLQKLWLVAVENLAAHGWVPVVEETENVVGTQRPRGVRRAKGREPSIDLPVTTTYFHNASKNETLDLLDIHLENETWETYLLHCLPMLTRAKWFGGKMRWPVEVVAFTTLHEREQEEGSTSIKSKVAILDTLMMEEDEDDSYVVVRSMVRGGVWRGIDKELSRSARETETTPGPAAELGEMDMSKLPGEAPQDSWLTSTLVGLTALNIRRLLGGRDRATKGGARVLFVGLGCGHLVSAIARYFYRDHSRMSSAGAEGLRLDVLEPDTEVVAGAEEFFGFVKAGGVQADAARERASRGPYTGPGSVPAFSSADADRSSQVVRKRKKKASNLRELGDVIPARVVNTAEEIEDCVYDIIVVDGVVALEKLVSQKEVESSPGDALCSWLERRLRAGTGTVIVSGQRNRNAMRTTFGTNATSLTQLFRNSNGTWQTVGEFTLRAGAAADAKEQASTEDVVGVGSFRHKMELSLAEWSEVVVEQEDALVYNSKNDAESSSSSTAARADAQPFELPTLREAQRSEVLHMKNVLSSSEIDQIGAFANLCADQRIGSEVRSHDEKTAKAWKVLFLQQELRFQKAFPDLCARLKRRVVETIRTSQKEKGAESCWTRLLDQCRSSDSDRGSDIDGKVEHEDSPPVTLNMRVIEYHRQVAPSPGLPDPWHYDQDSIFTLDILLSEAEGKAFEGGQFKTLEYDGNLQEHRFGKQGNAVLFVSHKHHCVQPVTKGERRVLVIEFWPWAERSCGHRCEVAARRACPMEKGGKIASPAEAVKSLSTPRNTANTEHAEPQTESKQCTAADTKEAFRMEGGVDVSACLPLPMRLGNVVVSSVGEVDEEDNAGVTHRILWQGNEVQAGQIQAVPEKMDTKDDAWDLFD